MTAAERLRTRNEQSTLRVQHFSDFPYTDTLRPDDFFSY